MESTKKAWILIIIGIFLILQIVIMPVILTDLFGKELGITSFGYALWFFGIGVILLAIGIWMLKHSIIRDIHREKPRYHKYHRRH